MPYGVQGNMGCNQIPGTTNILVALTTGVNVEIFYHSCSGNKLECLALASIFIFKLVSKSVKPHLEWDTLKSSTHETYSLVPKYKTCLKYYSRTNTQVYFSGK